MVRILSVLTLAVAAASALAGPSCAWAFQDKVIHLRGVAITATASATQPCGVDFLIAVSDGDQHLVKIDYSYNGTFKDNPVATDVPMNLRKGTRSDALNVPVGRLTLHGNLARVAARNDGLLCREAWAFHFIASEYNADQDRRDVQEELKRKEQARIDELNRKRAEEAQAKQRTLQLQQEIRLAHAKAQQEGLQAYRSASPENARCIINDSADIARCEEWKAAERARVREAAIQQEAAAARQAEIDAALLRQARASSEGVARATRDMEANDCSYGAMLPYLIPYPTVNTNDAQHQAEIKRIDALNLAAQEKFFRETKMASDACDARKANQGALRQQPQAPFAQQSVEQAVPVQETQPAVALPRRGVTAATTLLQGSVSQAELEKVDPSARQAREREERERIQSNLQAGADAEVRTNERLAAMGQVMGQISQLGQGRGGGTVAAIVPGAQTPSRPVNPPSPGPLPNAGNPPVAAQPPGGPVFCQPGRTYDAHLCSCYVNPRGIGCEGVGVGVRPAQGPGNMPANARPDRSTAGDTSAFWAQREREVAEQNRRIKELADQDRQRNRLAQAEIEAQRRAKAAAHHPENVANKCVSVIFEHAKQYFRNDCPWPVTIRWPAGIWNMGPGATYPTMQERSFSFFACKFEIKGGAGMGKGDVCHN